MSIFSWQVCQSLLTNLNEKKGLELGTNFGCDTELPAELPGPAGSSTEKLHTLEGAAQSRHHVQRPWSAGWQLIALQVFSWELGGNGWVYVENRYCKKI